MFKGKIVKVILSRNANEELEYLKKVVREENSEGINNSEYQTLLRSISQKISLIKDNPQYGIHIAKKKIPVEYASRYDVDNLWKVNLSGYWRMIYTITGSEVEIIALILEIINHKEYDKKFKYRKK